MDPGFACLEAYIRLAKILPGKVGIDESPSFGRYLVLSMIG